MVRELLLAGGVHVHVARAGVLADDHAFVDLDAGPREHLASLLEVHYGGRSGLAGPVGDETPGGAGWKLAEPRLVPLEDMVQQPGPSRLGEELGPEPEEGPRRDEILEADPPGAVVHHLLEPTLAGREQLRGDAQMLLGDVDRHALHRLLKPRPSA